MSSLEQPIAMGIDLGTSYTCVGIMRNDGKTVDIIANFQGSRITPSCVTFGEDEIHLGEAAKELMMMNPENTVYDIKRIIGRVFDDKNIQNRRKFWPFEVVDIGNSPKVQVVYKGETKLYSPEEISAIILTEIKKMVKSYTSREVTDAVITVPAYFSDSQRQATKDAAKIAGLNVLHVINEPTAAAIAYGFDKNITNQKNILVYDLGGGTFDVAILSIENKEFVVKAVGGDASLGGSDFDELLVKHALEYINRTQNKDLNGNKKALAKLNIACETAKRRLSSCEKTNINIACLYDQKDFSMPITRSKFDNLCNKSFQYTLECIEVVLNESKLSKSDIEEIVLVGGSTRIPKIQELLSKFFNGKKLNRGIQPDEAVAYGAALKAASLSGMFSMKEVFLADVTPMSLGIQSGDGSMIISIKRNTPLPISCTSTWTTAHDNQSEVEFCLYEGENVRALDNNLLGSFCLSNILRAKQGIPRIDVTFKIDAEGILEVSCIDRTTLGCSDIRVRSSKGRLTNPQIDRMMKEVEMLNI